ncbi:MAG: hypothetical protein LZF86_220003 [Nitrospira sp.]|nr:MAG: hypothetical protein LZF86_220003 [Nitrospira sp.]
MKHTLFASCRRTSSPLTESIQLAAWGETPYLHLFLILLNPYVPIQTQPVNREFLSKTLDLLLRS